MSSEILAKLRTRSWTERLLLFEASGFLALSRMAIWIVPFRRIASVLGRPMSESPGGVESRREFHARQVGWAVRAVARRTPWKNNCLVQALAAKIMLRRRGIASTVYLGVAKESGKELNAHAWLRSGDVILTGKRKSGEFTVLSTFSERRPGSLD